MTNPYGPWATAIDAGGSPQLSAFWKQRLTMLVPTSQTSSVLSRRNLLGLAVVAALIGVLPTFLAAPAVAENGKAEQPPAARPDADFTPAKTVRGKVVDENGRPISGADVWMAPAWDLWRVGPATHATADAEGRFILPVAPRPNRDEKEPLPIPSPLWAYATGHQLGIAPAADQIFGRNKSDVVIRLGPAVETSLVVWGPDKQPRAGALVEPESYGENPFPLPAEVRSRVAARTDAKGRVVLTAVRQSELHAVRIVTQDLGVLTQGLGKEITWSGTLPEGQPIRLRQGGRIVGHVTAEKPEWARGVRIILVTMPQLPGLPQGYADVESDENGEFVVPAMAAGELSVDAYVNSKLPPLPRVPDFRGARTVYVRYGETTKLEIPVVRTVAVHGSIIAKDTGRPIATTLIEVAYGSEFMRTRYRFADAQGRFTAPVLPGRVRVSASGPPSGILPPDGYVQFGASPEYDVPENVKEFQTPPLELVRSKVISGRVIDQDDHPVAKLMVWMDLDGRSYGYGQSNAKGELTFTGVPTMIDLTKVKYQASLSNGQGEEMDTTVVQASPLVLRAVPRNPWQYRP